MGINEGGSSRAIIEKGFDKIDKDNKWICDHLQELLQDKDVSMPKFISDELKLISNFLPTIDLATTIVSGFAKTMLWIEQSAQENSTAITNSRREIVANSLKEAYDQSANKSLLELQNTKDSLSKELETLLHWAQTVIAKREVEVENILKYSGVKMDDVSSVPFQDKILASTFGKTNEELIRDILKLAGKQLGVSIRLEENRASETLLQGKAETTQNNPATKTPSSTLQTEVAAKPAVAAVKQADSSSYENLANTVKQKTVPAMEELQTIQATSSVALETQNRDVDTLSDSYSAYAEILRLVAESIKVQTQAETEAAQSKNASMQALEQASDKAKKSVDTLAGNSLVDLANGLAGAIVKGQSFGETLKSIGENILYTILQMQLLNLTMRLFGSLFGSGSPIDPYIIDMEAPLWNAKGNVFDSYGLQRFARGGIVSQPTLFGFAKGTGLMGEVGAEAIMPLGRDSRGNLGVRIADSAMSETSSGGGVFAPHVEINVENRGGGDMTEDQARTLGAQVKALVEMQVAKQMYEYARSGMLRPSSGRGY